MKEEIKIFLEHILENITDIEHFLVGISKKELISNKEKQNAVVRSLEIIGETAKNLPNNFREEHSEVKWSEIIGTRDKVIHHYFGVDLNIIWEIVKKDLPDLKKKIQEIKRQPEKIK